jgi:predicted GNAT family N-acyltransferase
MLIRQVTYNSPEYLESLSLRTEILRLPLGKKLSPEDTAGEESQLHFGCFIGQHLISCAVVKPLNNVARAKLRQMAVERHSQGKGIGKKLIMSIEATLSQQGIKELELSARKTATGFYEKLGYHCVGEYYLEQGIDHIKMQKVI